MVSLPLNSLAIIIFSIRAQNELPRPGVEIVCDDGVCSQCVKTSEWVRPWILRHGERDPEDFLRDGFVCAEEFREDSEAERVCDDGLCVGCKVRQYELELDRNF